MTAALPEGIVTFLFTDIEGSTRLLTEIGNAAYAEALATHKTLVQAAVDAEGGVTVAFEGDAVGDGMAQRSGKARKRPAPRCNLSSRGAACLCRTCR